MAKLRFSFDKQVNEFIIVLSSTNEMSKVSKRKNNKRCAN